MPNLGLAHDQHIGRKAYGSHHANVHHPAHRARGPREPRHPTHYSRPPPYQGRHPPPPYRGQHLPTPYQGHPRNHSHSTKMAEDPDRPMIPKEVEKSAYNDRNPYQTLCHPLPERKLESRLSASSVSYHDPEMDVPRLKLWVILEVTAGLISVICAALLVPFGAEHSDVIHSISFMFGLMYITTGIATGLCKRWKSAISMKICLAINAFGAILATFGIVLGILSIFGLFQGQGAEERVVLAKEHYDIATHALTGMAMLAAILEIVPASIIVYSIIRAWKTRADEMALPVNV